MTSASGYRRALAVAGFFTLAAGDVWRYSLTWVGWGIIAGGLILLCAIELVRTRVDVHRLPLGLLAFLLLISLSIIWSHYPGASALGVLSTLATATFGVYAASLLNWSEMLRALGTALRIALAASLAFELIVSVFVRDKLLPFWVDYSDLEKIPNAFYWSRNQLFDGGPIQGIMGNTNLLAIAALLGLIVFAVQFASKEISRAAGIGWIVVALVTLGLTRSATVVVSGVVVALVAVFILIVRRTHGAARIAAHVGGLLVLSAAAIVAIVARGPLLALLDRSPDLTNRFEIWGKVADLAVQRPVAGWGWVSYWAPWVDPYDDLAIIKGVRYLQAHDAWLDIFLQLGIIGLIVFGILVLSTGARSWSLAITADEAATPTWPVAVAAPLLFTALLIQSIAESRLLIELGFALLVALCVATKRAQMVDRAVGRPVDRTGPEQ